MGLVDQAGAVAVMHAMQPHRSKRQARNIADWLAWHDVNDELCGIWGVAGS